MAVGYASRNVPSSDNPSSTVFDSHSAPSAARVLTCKPSLKTVDSLFFTGEKEHVQKSVSFAEQRSQTQRKRTEASSTGSFDGPVIDIALVACGLSSALFFSQNAASRSSYDLKSPLYQSLPLNVKYIVDVKLDLASFACANGTDVAKYGDLVALVWDLKTNKRSVTPFSSSRQGTHNAASARNRHECSQSWRPFAYRRHSARITLRKNGD